MKAANKILLGISLALLVAGGALNAAGTAMGGREESRGQSELLIGGENGIHLSPGRISIGGENGITFSPSQIGIGGFHRLPSPERADMAGEKVSAFTDLEVEVSVADILVTEGEDYAVDCTWESDRFQLFHCVRDGKLKIWSEDAEEHLRWTDVGAYITITLPVDAELGEVEISTELGSVTWEAVAVACEAELSTDLGSITCSGLLTRELECSSDLGSVTVLLPGPKEDFRWELKGSLGQLSLDGEVLNGGMGDLLVTGGTGEKLIKASTDLGSVDVSFS